MNLKSEVAPKGLQFKPMDFIISGKYATILSVISYPKFINPGFLANLTNIAGVKLVGVISLEDIGAQPVGNYLTSIPASYTSEIKAYADTKASAAKSESISDAASKYATITDLLNLQSQVETLSSNTSSTYAKVFVGTGTPASPKNGDIWVTI